uniref:Uncharacterized protein n=1 Tax=Cacopsylla melanoneura TaxID=428564 RepID=A0A8D8RCQ0_9HEMI
MGSSGLAYTCFFVIDKIQFSPNYKFVEYFLLSNESIHSFSLLHFAYSSRQELSTILFKSLMFIKCIPCSSEILTIRSVGTDIILMRVLFHSLYALHTMRYSFLYSFKSLFAFFFFAKLSAVY